MYRICLKRWTTTSSWMIIWWLDRIYMYSCKQKYWKPQIQSYSDIVLQYWILEWNAWHSCKYDSVSIFYPWVMTFQKFIWPQCYYISIKAGDPNILKFLYSNLEFLRYSDVGVLLNRLSLHCKYWGSIKFARLRCIFDQNTQYCKTCVLPIVSYWKQGIQIFWTLIWGKEANLL